MIQRRKLERESSREAQSRRPEIVVCLMTRPGRYRVNNIVGRRCFSSPLLSTPFKRGEKSAVLKPSPFYDPRAIYPAARRGNIRRMRYFTRCIIDDLLLHGRPPLPPLVRRQ